MSYTLKVLVSDPDSGVISVPISNILIQAEAATDFTRRFTFMDTNGDPMDLTGYSFQIQVMDVERTLLLEWLNADFTFVATGVYDIAKTALEMDVDPGWYSYEVQVTYPSEEVHTWVFGNFEIQVTT